MVGQGSPKTSHPDGSGPRAASRLGTVWILALIFWTLGRVSPAEECHLRLSWGGKARQWAGSVSLSEGTIEFQEPIGVEPDEPGSMWLDNGNLAVRQRSTRSYDAVDILVRAPQTARLAIRLTAAGDEPSDQAVEVPLETVLRDGFTSALDAQGSRLRVTRKPGDLLPIELVSPSLVFNPGDRLNFRLETTRLAVAPAEKIRLIA
ncbi:MAG: hypothetical protein ACYC6Y_25285, partial [Thermoguttaceae bacterium]